VKGDVDQLIFRVGSQVLGDLRFMEPLSASVLRISASAW